MRLPWEQSDLHPHALSLIEPDVTDPDFEHDLRQDLAAFNPPDIIHRYRVVVPDGQGTHALSEQGFAPTRLTRLFRLPLVATAGDPLPAQIAAHWFRPGERAPWHDWIAAHWRHYRMTHTSNPPREPETGLHDVFVGDDLIEGLALRDGPMGRVRAFASLREGQGLGWIGGAPDLLPAVLAACLRRATAIGWTYATLEVDDDDYGLWSLTDPMVEHTQMTFVTWQRERAGTVGPH